MIAWLLPLLGAATLVAAWWQPGSAMCAALGWTSLAFFYAGLCISKRRLLRFFVTGIATYTGGFYWLYNTIGDFGGFPTAAAFAIFALYVCGSAVQFCIWAFAWNYLPPIITRLGMRTALSWLIAHSFWIKIFPWDFGHTQLGFVAFAQLAGVLGVPGITFIMMWVVEALCARRTVPVAARALALLCFGATLGYGVWIQDTLAKHPSSPLSTVMVQGNVSLQHKHDMTFFTVNREQYLKVSASVAEKDTLVIWPESTITEFIPATTSDARQASLLPFLNNGSAFLVGGLTYRSKTEYFNSSILIRPDGSVDAPYHKMILMPFGEYTPMSSWLPWLAEINSTAGQFTAGDEPKVLTFVLSDGRTAKLSPLICYEDVIPELAREATRRGAELLINQTNDAWFGNTVAPYQHHMIASFRAIENRRYLLRSTNTGLTAVVDPLGRTLASLLPYTESVLPMEIGLVSYVSSYTQLPIQLLWLLIATVGVGAVVVRSVSLRKRAR